MKNFLANADGVAMVEFAILAPLLVIIMVGSIDIGRYTWDEMQTSNAAHAAVQYAAQNITNTSNSAGILAAVNNDANVVYTADEVSLAPLIQAPDGIGVLVKVTVSHSFSTIINYYAIPQTITMTHAAIQEMIP